ncbi:MAG: NADAR domain-containing protein [Eubacteriales bacterium]|nr:NADAR domain-containing protein [Eubacteriales bacterium]
MSSIEIRKIGITDLDTDAIVNAANDGLWAGGGVCGAIFKAAGYDQLQTACNKIGHCDTGSAVITPGFNLKAKYIIHAVGPRWMDGEHEEPKLLYSAYRRSLELAVKNGCKSIGFPLISAGIFGYPVDLAWRQALRACRDFIKRGNQIDIIFAVLSDSIIEIGQKTLKQVYPQIANAVKDDWKTFDMPAQHDTFTLVRSFTSEQMKALRKGNIPKAMEDKWFWYMEGDTLFAHRSWTGFCFYRIDFSSDDHHKVTVNRDPEQYKGTSVDEDRKTLNKLLNWWSGAPYDYYHEWLSETVDNLNKAGMVYDKLKIAKQKVEALFFYRASEPHGYLSNWYMSPFELDGVHFSSAEQYIMYNKCLIFGDAKSAGAILKEKHPRVQRAIGRGVKGYVDAVWAGQRQLVAVRGLLAKFSQNEDLKKKLLDTGDVWLVECDDSDTIWSCGIPLNEDERFDAGKWRGQNILGFALMEVRSILRGDE